MPITSVQYGELPNQAVIRRKCDTSGESEDLEKLLTLSDAPVQDLMVEGEEQNLRSLVKTLGQKLQ